MSDYNTKITSQTITTEESKKYCLDSQCLQHKGQNSWRRCLQIQRELACTIHFSTTCAPSKHWNYEAISQGVDEVSFRGPFRGQNCKRCSKVWWCLIHKFSVYMNWNQHIFSQQTLCKSHRKVGKCFSRLVFFFFFFAMSWTWEYYVPHHVICCATEIMWRSYCNAET